MILKPVSTEKFHLSKNTELDPIVAFLVNSFGGDILALIPNKALHDAERVSKTERLLRSSSNPWNITAQEFMVIKVVFHLISVIAAILIFIIANALGQMIIGGIVALVVLLLMFNYAETYHKGITREREIDFLYNLPEAIDYLVMALSGGGYTLASAFGEVIQYLRPSEVKTEFKRIVSDLRAGKTMEAALEDFAYRAPAESVKSFTKALSNANAQSVSIIDILKARSKASRTELNNEINKKIIKLPSSMTLILSPTMLVTMLLVVGAPAMFILSNSF